MAGYLCAPCVSACTRARGCVPAEAPSDRYCGCRNTEFPADAEILSSQHFQTLSLLTDDVYLEDFIYLISPIRATTVHLRNPCIQKNAFKVLRGLYKISEKT